MTSVSSTVRSVKRTKAIIIVRPVGESIPLYWPLSSADDKAAWMTLHAEHGWIIGKTLGLAFDLAIPAHWVERTVCAFLESEERLGYAWDLQILRIEARRLPMRKRPYHRRKP